PRGAHRPWHSAPTGHYAPRYAVPLLAQRRGVAVVTVVVPHCPQVRLSVRHDSDRLEQIVVRADVRAGHNAPASTVPMLNQCLLSQDLRGEAGDKMVANRPNIV